MKNRYLKTTLTLITLVFITACSEDDLTGTSTTKATSPSLSVTLDFANSQSLVEMDSTYNFTVTLSEPQIVDTRVYLTQTGGTATSGEDFGFPSNVTIPKGATSASGTIEIFEDDLAEETETATILIGTGLETNVGSTSPQTVTFTIMNITEGDVVIDMTWTSPESITDNLGAAIPDEDLANLVLYVRDSNIPTSITYLGINDEDGFESFVFLENFPDGEYYLVAEFISAVDYGDIYADLDITLEFNQKGVINNQTVTVPGALNTEYATCQSTIIAKLTKSGGADYSVERVGLPNNMGIPADGEFVGDYTVSTISSGQFGPSFDGSVTLVDEGNNVRSFIGDWNAFGRNLTWEFAFDPTCGTVTFVDNQSTGLACPGGPLITHGSSPEAEAIDPTDDSSFTITYTENTLSACSGVPTNVTIMFTKV